MLGSRGQRYWVSSKSQLWHFGILRNLLSMENSSQSGLFAAGVGEQSCPTVSGKGVDLWQFQWCWRLFSVSFVALIMPCFFSKVCLKDMLWGLGEAGGAHSPLQHLAKSVLVSLNLLALVGVYNAPMYRKQERCWAEVFGSYGVCAMNRLCVHTLFGGELPFLCLISVE